MPDTTLTLDDLVAGLTAREGYFALSVYAADVQPAVDDARSAGRLRDERPDQKGIEFEKDGIIYVLNFDERGTARLWRKDRPPPPPRVSSASSGAGVFAGGAGGAAVGAAIGRAADPRGDGWAAGMVLGLLTGALLGAAIDGNTSSPATQPRKVLTMRFDPMKGWVAYDGGLVTWMKEELATAG